VILEVQGAPEAEKFFDEDVQVLGISNLLRP
jgi:hypothetical protein